MRQVLFLTHSSCYLIDPRKPTRIVCTRRVLHQACLFLYLLRALHIMLENGVTLVLFREASLWLQDIHTGHCMHRITIISSDSQWLEGYNVSWVVSGFYKQGNHWRIGFKYSSTVVRRLLHDPCTMTSSSLWCHITLLTGVPWIATQNFQPLLFNSYFLQIFKFTT